MPAIATADGQFIYPHAMQPPQQVEDTIVSALSGFTIPDVGQITGEEWEAMQAIKWNDGSNIISLENRPLCYEIYFMLRHAEIAKSSRSLRVNSKLKVEDYETGKKDYVGFRDTCDNLIAFFGALSKPKNISTHAILDLSLYAEEKMAYLVNTDGLRSSISTVQGVDPCRTCGSYNTLAVSKQLRSADEPETRFVNCLACGDNWREN